MDPMIETDALPAQAEGTSVTAVNAEKMTAADTQLPYLPAADAMKFWLMPFVCFLCFGFPTQYGGVISALCGFAPLCFYLLCGFFAVTGEEDEAERLKQGVLRSGQMLLIMFIVCLTVNVLYLVLSGASLGDVFRALLGKRILFNFFVLSIWPFQMGESIWFIQSLFYGYIILLILNTLKLKRLRIPLMLLGFLFLLVSGELSGVVGFRVFGYPYFPPNVWSCALPYMLLGSLIREKMDNLVENKGLLLLLLVPLGLALAYGEFELLLRFDLLATTGHAVGLGLAAFGLCTWVLLYLDMEPDFYCVAGRYVAQRIYLYSQPIAFLLIVPMSIYYPIGGAVVQKLGGLIVYVVCMTLSVIGFLLSEDKEEESEESSDEAEI